MNMKPRDIHHWSLLPDFTTYLRYTHELAIGPSIPSFYYWYLLLVFTTGLYYIPAAYP